MLTKMKIVENVNNRRHHHQWRRRVHVDGMSLRQVLLLFTTTTMMMMMVTIMAIGFGLQLRVSLPALQGKLKLDLKHILYVWSDCVGVQGMNRVFL